MEELVRRYLSEHISRRDFVRQLTALGLSVAASQTLLAQLEPNTPMGQGKRRHPGPRGVGAQSRGHELGRQHGTLVGRREHQSGRGGQDGLEDPAGADRSAERQARPGMRSSATSTRRMGSEKRDTGGARRSRSRSTEPGPVDRVGRSRRDDAGRAALRRDAARRSASGSRARGGRNATGATGAAGATAAGERAAKSARHSGVRDATHPRRWRAGRGHHHL